MPSPEQYRLLAAFRHQLRQFLAFSAREAEAAGLPPQQYQALLAIKGHAGPAAITVGELADTLVVRHHTAAELVNRMEDAGLVRRAADTADRRRVMIHLTAAGETALEGLAAVHLRELRESGAAIANLLSRIDLGPG